MVHRPDDVATIVTATNLADNNGGGADALFADIAHLLTRAFLRARKGRPLVSRWSVRDSGGNPGERFSPWERPEQCILRFKAGVVPQRSHVANPCLALGIASAQMNIFLD